MSKSILVIDTPSVCIDCPCHFAYDTGKVKCGVNGNEILSNDIETFKPDWCPIKEIPKHKGICHVPCFLNAQEAYAYGYNSCIERILEEIPK